MGENSERRKRHEVGLYRKQGVVTDKRTGEQTPYDYWQASRDVPVQFLPDGVVMWRFLRVGCRRSAIDDSWRALVRTNWPCAADRPEAFRSVNQGLLLPPLARLRKAQAGGHDAR